MKRKTILLTMLTGLMMALPTTAMGAGGGFERGITRDRLPIQPAVFQNAVGSAQLNRAAQIEFVGNRRFRGRSLKRGGFGQHRGFSRNHRGFNRRQRGFGFGRHHGFSNYYGHRGSYYGYDRYDRGQRFFLK